MVALVGTVVGAGAWMCSLVELLRISLRAVFLLSRLTVLTDRASIGHAACAER